MNQRLLVRIVTALLLLAGAISLSLWSALPPSIPARGIFHDSAGPAIHTALSRLDQGSRVRAWLNLGGTLRGVPLLDWLQRAPQRWVFDLIVWMQDWRQESLDSLTNRVLRERSEELSIPEEIQVFNYISMSLSGDISDFGWDKYLLMRPDGPNDGLSLLPDLLVPEGRTIVSPKGDHFFAEDPLIEEKSVALVLTVLESIDH